MSDKPCDLYYTETIASLERENAKLREELKEVAAAGQRDGALALTYYELQKVERKRWVTVEATLNALGEHLAMVHGDGGHYEAEYGTVKAIQDATVIVTDLRERVDELETALQSIIRELDGWPNTTQATNLARIALGLEQK